MIIDNKMGASCAHLFCLLGGVFIIKNKQTDELLNENIGFDRLLVIDENGEQLGILSKSDALYKARNRELDLYVVAPNGKPPVAKFINYSKFRYEQQKKTKEVKKNQRVIQVKEIKLSATIDKHDLDTKANQARKFLMKGDKVKVTIRMGGRMITHADIVKQVMVGFINSLEDCSKIEANIKQDGKILSAVLTQKLEK